MLHALRPGHFTDVNKPLDTLLEFYERAVIGDADHAASHVCAYRIAVLRIQPWIRRELFESERNSLLLFVELQNLHLDLIADIHEIARMREPSPGHIGDVQQSVNPAHINESAIFGEVLHHSS